MTPLFSKVPPHFQVAVAQDLRVIRLSSHLIAKQPLDTADCHHSILREPEIFSSQIPLWKISLIQPAFPLGGGSLLFSNAPAHYLLVNLYDLNTFTMFFLSTESLKATTPKCVQDMYLKSLCNFQVPLTALSGFPFQVDLSCFPTSSPS